MKHNDLNKLIRAGFTIVRVADFPSTCIKFRNDVDKGFRILKEFHSKVDRNRALQELLTDPMTVEDEL